MGAEVLLYGYGLVCASMLVFNLLYGLHLRSDDRRMERRTGRLRRQVEKQLAEIREASDGISHPDPGQSPDLDAPPPVSHQRASGL